MREIREVLKTPPGTSPLLSCSDVVPINPAEDKLKVTGSQFFFARPCPAPLLCCLKQV